MNSDTSGAQCWALPLADLAFSKWKSMLLSPFINLISAIMVTLFIDPLTGMAEEKSWLSTKWAILSTWFLNSSWADEHHYPHILCPFGEIYPHVFPPYVILTNFPIMFFPSPWPSSPSFGCLHGYKSKWIQGIIAHLVISLSKQNVWPCLLPVILPAMKISLCWCLSMSHKGLQCCNHLFLGSDCITCRAISKPGPSLFFLTQLIIGNMPQCYKCMLAANGMITGVENRKKK